MRNLHVMIIYCIIWPNDIRRALRVLRNKLSKVTHTPNFSSSTSAHLGEYSLLWQIERTTLYKVKFELTVKTHLNLAFFRAKLIK